MEDGFNTRNIVERYTTIKKEFEESVIATKKEKILNRNSNEKMKKRLEAAFERLEK